MNFKVDDLIEQGLVKKKVYTDGKYKGLSVLKYARKVFYDNLWSIDERLLECRGVVVDEDWNVIVLPFKKVFNYGENGTTVDPEREVICPRKVNGFMLSVTYNKNYGYIVSTTGSLDSDFVKLGEQWLETLDKGALSEEGITHIFEVCDKSDPHIVDEQEGIYLIGRRSHTTGKLYPEMFLNGFAEVVGCKRPELWKGCFKDLPINIKHEGFMVRDYFHEDTLCKIKSRHYLINKFFSRVGASKLNTIYSASFKEQVDEEYYPLQEFIIGNYSKKVWSDKCEQERLQICKEFL